jgi:hypothetical protein
MMMFQAVIKVLGGQALGLASRHKPNVKSLRNHLQLFQLYSLWVILARLHPQFALESEIPVQHRVLHMRQLLQAKEC